MTKASAISLKQSDRNIIAELVGKKVEVGMIEFNCKPEFGFVPDKFEKIGNFELDVLVIEKSTGRVLMLDHDQLDFVMGKVAKNIYSFIEALVEVEKFYEACQKDEKLYDNEEAMRIVALKASEAAGGSAYSNFYMTHFGI